MSKLKKLPQVKPDLLRTDDNWVEWGMKELIEKLLQRNKTDGFSTVTGDSCKWKRYWYTQGAKDT